tara:strand:- start:822 stop:1367 length:546 start_codon:yes stop_codon:yes gene_type:complete
MTNVIYLDLKGGVLDDEILCKVDAIAQQLNCLACKPHGLSKGVADKLYYGCSYKHRTVLNKNTCIEADRGVPGTNDVRYPRKEDTHLPMVINMYGQWEKSKPFRYNSVRPAPNDSYVSRRKWFQECLDDIPNINPTPPKSIAFPYEIGCCLAGGNWVLYEAMLVEFAERMGIQVYICKWCP